MRPAKPPGAIRSRRDFARLSRRRRVHAPGFALQGMWREDGDETIRVGFVCSKKIGNAVARNRARRRLRALSREVIGQCGKPGWDYVLAGKPEATALREFRVLASELESALAELHG